MKHFCMLIIHCKPTKEISWQIYRRNSARALKLKWNVDLLVFFILLPANNFSSAAVFDLNTFPIPRVRSIELEILRSFLSNDYKMKHNIRHTILLK